MNTGYTDGAIDIHRQEMGQYTAEEIVTEKSSGCGSAAFGAALIAALCGGAVAVRKKRRVH